MAGPLVSVIVPVYNVAPYLGECLDSILGQTYRDLDVVVVDDGSHDGSGNLCGQYASADARVRVVHQPNAGLAAARNKGLELARGSYIAFVDGDDAVAPHFVASLLGAHADVAQCGFCRSPEGCAGSNEAVELERLSGRDATERLQYDGTGSATVVWNKLYRRELLSGERFPEGRQHEDEFLTYRLLWKARTVAVSDAPLYYYRQRPASIMGAGFSRRSLDVFEALDERRRFYLDAGEDRFAAMTDVVACYRLHALLPSIVADLPGEAPSWKRAYRLLCSRVLRSPHVSLKKKLALGVRALTSRCAAAKACQGPKKELRNGIDG